jgi:hypothetical protein
VDILYFNGYTELKTSTNYFEHSEQVKLILEKNESHIWLGTLLYGRILLSDAAFAWISAVK